MKKFYYIIKTILLILFLLFILFFAIENSEIIKINLIFSKVIEIRIFFLIILSFFIGFFTGILVTTPKLISDFFKLLKEKRKNKKLENGK